MRSSTAVRVSYQLLPEQPLDELLDTLELLDHLGFWACYGADETYHKDIWSLLAAGAARTSRLRLGREVAGIILKDPTLVAQQVATLDELTGGRAELVQTDRGLVPKGDGWFVLNARDTQWWGCGGLPRV